MTAEKQQKIVSDFFKGNPDAQKCHLTDDGEAFANKSYADLHANTGKAKKMKITSFNNTNSKDGSGKSSHGKKDAQPPATKMKSLRGMKQPELIKLAKTEKVDITGIKSNAKIVLAIQAKRDALKDTEQNQQGIKLHPTDLQKIADDLKIDVATLDTPEKIKAAQEQLKTK